VGENGRPEDWPQFDDSFVAAAAYREPDSEQRRREKERQAAKQRADQLRAQEAASIELGHRRQRRERRRQLLPRHGWKVLAVAAAVAVGVVVYNRVAAGNTPQTAAAISNTSPTVTAAPASSVPETSTSLQLQRRDFQSGNCVLWDQTATGNGPWGVPTQVVGCSHPHLVEIVGTAQQIAGFGQSWPGEAAIDAYTNQHCAAPIRSFLGYGLDPYGRFGIGSIQPTPDGWMAGDRSYYCDIQLSSGAPSTAKLTLFTGEVRGADQELLDPVGSCLKVGAPVPVPCSGPHQLELTGNVTISAGATQWPASAERWQMLVGSRCANVNLNYVGGTYPPGYQTSWLELPASSWAAGERTIQCTIGRPSLAAGSSSWASTTGSVRR
jgi:hypothetical protein